MMKLLGLCISCLVLGITVGLPTKDIDELIYRLEELKQQNHYVGGGRRPRTTDPNNNSVLNGKPSGHHTVELEEKPLLYDYYANTLNPIIDRRTTEEIDSRVGKRSIDIDLDRFPKRFFLERSRTLPSIQEQQQKQQMHNFHEIADKADYQDYMKRMMNDDRVVAKRNFDEIDRFGLNRFVQPSPSHAWTKRNFDEIDRLVPQVFTDNKREEGSNDMTRSGKYSKFV